MIKLRRSLTRFIAPVFLLPILTLQAQTTVQPSTIAASTLPPLPTVSCDDLTRGAMFSRQTTGVQKQLNHYAGLINKRQCVILRANPADDLSELIRRIPENTVVFLSSETVSVTSTPSINGISATSAAQFASTATPSPATSSAPDKMPVEYFTDSEIFLKDGQDIIGAADDSFEIIIRDRPAFTDQHLLRIGARDNFRSGETKDSNIRHITFRPTRNNKRRPINSIVFAACYNRTLILEDNVFYPPVQAAVMLDCEKPLDADVTGWFRGPGLRFADNHVIGEKYSSINDKVFPDFIPNHGILINLPKISNQSKRIAVIGNTFEGNIAEAGEFKLGSATRMEVLKNTVDISNAGNTTRNSVRKGGFVLEGTTDTAIPPPVFYLAGNKIWVSRIAITVRGQLKLALVCNHLQAFNPWWQPQKRLSLQAIPLPLEEVTALKLCPGALSSTAVMSTPGSTAVMPTPSPLAASLTANTWTAINYSSASACDGLVNLKGQLFFDTETCQPVTSASVPNISATEFPTSSTDTTSVATVLGVMITLAILLIL